MSNRALPDVAVGRGLELRSFVQFLDSCGVPWHALARRAGLPDHIPGSETFVPTQLVARFLSDLILRENFREMSARAALGPDGELHGCNPLSSLEKACLAAPSLFCAMQTLCARSARLWSHFRFWLKETERYVWVCSRTTTSPDAVGTEQQMQSRLLRLTGLIEQYLGFRWRPERVLLETRRVPSQLFEEIMGGARCIPGARFSALPIPRDLLAKSGPIARQPAGTLDTATSHPDPIDWTWLQRLQVVLPEYVIGNHLSIESLADIACVSPRTLQRALAEERLTFRDLLEAARFEVARERLSDPSASIAEVSELLGYSAPTHFARAFRRIAGRTPSDYREDLLSVA